MRETRAALRLAGLELFATEGFDAVTAEEIAEKAGVSRRTFFRYFRSKEEVLYFGEHRFFTQFSTIFLGLPSSVPDVDAVCATFAALSAHTARGRDALVLARRAVDSSAVLRGREQDRVRGDLEMVGRAIADRHRLAEPDERCRLLAALSMTTYRFALQRWLSAPPPGDFAQVIVEEFSLMSEITHRDGSRPG
ncbi:MAG TPA: TetR family transcriptional regulator [Acidimicrobiales bacterium]